MKDISSVCIRLSKQIKAVQEKWLRVLSAEIRISTTPYSRRQGAENNPSPGYMQTYQPGDGKPEFQSLRTAVIDERSELAASFGEYPQNDLGPRTDILDGCRKKDGIEIMLRGMAPQVIIMDELGGQYDAEAVKMAWNAGVRIIATAHAFNLKDFKGRLGVGQLASGGEGFERIILLGMNNGKRWAKVLDADDNELSFLDQNGRMSDGFFRLHCHGLKVVGKAGGEAACSSKISGDNPES